MDVLDQGATAEVETTVERSMDDTIRDTLQELSSRGESVEVAEVSDKPDTSRDEKGQFAKADEAESLVEAIASDVAPLVDTEPLPNTWKKEASEAWKKADPVLRAEVARRESDIHKGIEQYRQAADFAHVIDQTIAPYKQTLQNLGVAPQDAIRELMSADHKLRYGNQQDKEMYFSQLAKSYGIDLGRVQNTVQNTDPRLYDLAQQNQQLQQQIQSQQQAVQQQTDAALNSEISSFAADPKHTHFETVKGHMAALLQAGHAVNLSDAYEQAIYASPKTRAAVLQQQATTAKEEAAKKAQAAKAAAGVNLRSRPAMPVKQVIGSMEDTIRETYRRAIGQN